MKRKNRQIAVRFKDQSGELGAMNFKGLGLVDIRFGPKPDLKKDYEPRCRSIPRMLASPHILAGVLPIKRLNKAAIRTKHGALEEKLTF